MIENVRTGKPVSIVEYQELTENDPEFSFRINEVKKAWKREQPKVYRENRGRWSKSQNKVIKIEKHKIDFIEDLDVPMHILDGGQSD